MAEQHKRELSRAERDSQTVVYLKAARSSGGDAFSEVQSYILTGNEDLIPLIRQSATNAIDQLTVGQQLMLADSADEERLGQIQQIVSQSVPLAITFNEVISLRLSGDVAGATGHLLQAMPALQDVSANYDSLAVVEEGQESLLRARANRTATLTTLFLIIAGTIGLIAGSALAAVVVQSILRPLGKLETAAQALVDGDLAARAPEDGLAEFARLGSGFNRMTEALLDASKRRELEEERARALAELQVAHEQLNLTAERLDSVLTSIQDLVFSVDPVSHKVLYMNDNAESILGRTIADFKADSTLWLNMVLPEDRLVVQADFETVMTTSRGDAEFRILRPDGQIRRLRSRTRLIRDDGGKPLRVEGTYTDVTERREAEAQIRLQAQLLRAVGQAVIATDVAGKIIYCNQTAADLYGWTCDEMIGQPISAITIVDGSMTQAAEIVSKLTSGESWSGEFTVHRRDGGSFPASFTGSPVTGENGDAVGMIGVSADISERRGAEQALRESEQRWRALVQNASDLIVVLKPDSEFEYVSPAVVRITGRTPEDLIGLRALDRVHEDDREVLAEAIERLLAGGDPGQVDFRVRRADGKWCNLEAMGALMITPDGARCVLNARDVTDRLEAQALISFMAYHDSLTGLPNRAYFRQRKDAAIAEARRHDKNLWVLSIDLDNFKIVNDTLGHSAGDGLLRAAAERLSKLVRQEDTLARVGGDEFELLLTTCDSDETASRVAERIIKTFTQPFEIQGQACRTTASIGISRFPEHGIDAETVLRHADIAMYAAKEAGRNTVRFYEPGMNTHDREWLALESDLRLALERGELEVYYQPQVSTKSGEIVGVEALARWRHPTHGILLPGDFIPVAEETHLLPALGEQVLATACADVDSWDRDGISPVRLSVNVHYQQIEHPAFMDMLRSVLSRTPSLAGRLRLEITESAVLRDFDLVRGIAGELSAIGVCLSIDDFGTGNTTLRYLKDFPVCELKIDQSFVRDLKNPQSAMIVAGVISMGHSLNLSVVAEGVETEEQLHFLRERKCDEFQGFLHSHPMPAADLRARLAEAKPRLLLTGSKAG
jgi:diguanylate cyclase (GGDEF)-like protein/PAS domain S-box-containing protein